MKTVAFSQYSACFVQDGIKDLFAVRLVFLARVLFRVLKNIATTQETQTCLKYKFVCLIVMRGKAQSANLRMQTQPKSQKREI